MATRHLEGEFGTPREAVDADFPYFGETIRLHPDANDLAYTEMMIRARDIDMDDLDPNDPSTWDPELVAAAKEAADLAADMIRQQIHPDDWARFWKTARANRQMTIDLMTLSQRLAELVANFRTAPSAASSPGRRTTKSKSRAGSSSRARRTPSPSVRDTVITLEQFRGRPDLKAAALQAEMARRAAAAEEAAEAAGEAS
jgi:hypothetical protein